MKNNILAVYFVLSQHFLVILFNLGLKILEKIFITILENINK